MREDIRSFASFIISGLKLYDPEWECVGPSPVERHQPEAPSRGEAGVLWYNTRDSEEGLEEALREVRGEMRQGEGIDRQKYRVTMVHKGDYEWNVEAWCSDNGELTN